MIDTVYTIKTVDKNGEKYQALATTLHELKHAIQKEELGLDFWKRNYSCAIEIKDTSLADFYSQCEIEARSFENSNILLGVSIYNKFLQKD